MNEKGMAMASDDTVLVVDMRAKTSRGMLEATTEAVTVMARERVNGGRECSQRL